MMPQKQSSWCHIPLGRILAPLDKEKYAALLDHARLSQNKERFTVKVESLKVLHERRWYQSERTLLKLFSSHD